MIVPAYTPGHWYAVVTDGSIAMLPPQTAPTVLRQMWRTLREGAEMPDRLQVLLGPGLVGLPPFALVTLDAGRAHVVVRGEVVVEVSTDDADRVLGTPGVATWSEELVPGVRRVVVRAPGAAVEGRPALPLLSGTVLAGEVRVELSPSLAAVTPAQAQNVAVVPAPAENAAVAPAVAVSEPDPGTALPGGASGAAVAADAGTGNPAVGPAVSPAARDHDGMTVLSSDVAELRRELPGWKEDELPGPLTVTGPSTPAPAKILLSSGLVVALNRPVLLGRAPQVSRVANNKLPRLVTVASPNQDISRTHAEVRMDGEDVVVTDLRSTNGVLLLRQDAGPRRLHPGEPTVVPPGVVVDLGEGVTFVVERGS